MAQHNPAYQSLIERAAQFFRSLSLVSGSVIADVGAGTGNFSTMAAQLCPQCRILHIEPDDGMNAVATKKASALGLKNLTIIKAVADEANFEPHSVDVVIAVHSLYAMPAPIRAIRNFHYWLRPTGHVFACDLGRYLNTIDWFFYLAIQIFRHHGMIKTARIIVSATEVARQNSKIAHMQRTGSYWMHTPQEYAHAWQTSGFSILQQETQYRNCSDLIIAVKS